MTGLLNRDSLLRRVGGVKLHEVELPGGGSVLMRDLSAKEMRAWRKSYRKEDGDIDPTKQLYSGELLVGRMLVDPEKHQTIFTDADIFNDVLSTMSACDVETLVSAAQEIAGIKTDARTIIKNYSPTSAS